MSSFPLNFIACVDKKFGIAKAGQIPWDLVADMVHFKNKTMGGIVVMGRLTWESLKYELPGRHCIVVTSGGSDRKPPETTIRNLVCGTGLVRCTAKSAYEVIELCQLIRTHRHSPDVWIVGGQLIYQMFLPCVKTGSKLFLTTIDYDFECDRHFPINAIVFNDDPDQHHSVVNATLTELTKLDEVDRSTQKKHSLVFETYDLNQ